ncbi:DUF3488 and transglutaminase-like domain-containing protein [Saccharomonospora sp.]|uniref:transglutaminase family protein n=1 Tax=Saccharomonospora sp. TaxID=33913 RepID=UPI00260DFE7C|nr:DUF3488 and transglutaminase-like domain-containing protein [Saccharomonospora sp.]
MTTTASRPRHTRQRPESDRSAARGMAAASTLLAPAAAMFATVSAATSLTGVIEGGAWLAYIAVAALLVACTGLALRSLRLPTLLTAPAQALVLLLLATGAFTRNGILAVIPGPAAFSELNDVLTTAFEEIRTGVPPVEGSVSILCLATIAVGVVAILVDTLVVAASAPAAAGLVLLCVYAVPSALADDLLSWWTFVLGATAFAVLLAVDGSHRHSRWRNRSTPGTGVSAVAVSAPAAVVAGALSAGLVAGIAVTSVGTEGRLPGSSGDQAVLGGLGVNPFTSLRGMLDQGDDVPLFRVTGLDDDQRPLRAFTLDTYRPNEGWGLPDGPMPAGVPANGELPLASGDDGEAPGREIHIEPVHWNDVWLPVYGSPRVLRGLSDGWYYDHTSGSVFRERRQNPAAYTEVAALEEPTRAELRQVTSDPGAVADVYTNDSGVDPRVAELARRITASADTTFDKVHAVWRHFDTANGFTYDTQTAPAADSDALADFVLNGKRGYCEQFASTMAVMLRSLDIPARVAVGFTSGYRDGDARTITSRDAHAWVEVHFGELGWVSFDPTPLSDGRGYVPSYLDDDGASGSDRSGDDDAASSTPPESSSQSAQQPTQDQAEQEASAQPEQQRPFSTSDSWWGIAGMVLAAAAVIATVVAAVTARRRRENSPQGTGVGSLSWALILAVTLWALTVALVTWWVHWVVTLVLLAASALALVPWALRRVQRHRRLREVEQAQETAAADAAWRELLQECVDRGIDISEHDTVRITAQKIVQQQRLDKQAKNNLRAVVTTVERVWYSPEARRRDGRDTGFSKAFHDVLDGLERAAPLSWQDRLLPRSILRNVRRRSPRSR